MEFTAAIELNGKTATGIEVPDLVIEQLNSGKRPKVAVTIGKYTYSTTVGVMGGRSLIPLNAEHRKAAGVEAGQQVKVKLVLDSAPATITVPDDLATALQANDSAKTFFEGLPNSQRKEWVRWIEEAKKAETRATRVENSVALLAAGKKQH